MQVHKMDRTTYPSFNSPLLCNDWWNFKTAHLLKRVAVGFNTQVTCDVEQCALAKLGFPVVLDFGRRMSDSLTHTQSRLELINCPKNPKLDPIFLHFNSTKRKPQEIGTPNIVGSFV